MVIDLLDDDPIFFFLAGTKTYRLVCLGGQVCACIGRLFGRFGNMCKDRSDIMHRLMWCTIKDFITSRILYKKKLRWRSGLHSEDFQKQKGWACASVARLYDGELFSGKGVGRNSAASLEHLEQSFRAKLLFDCRVSGNAAAVLQARNMFFHSFFFFTLRFLGGRTTSVNSKAHSLDADSYFSTNSRANIFPAFSEEVGTMDTHVGISCISTSHWTRKSIKNATLEQGPVSIFFFGCASSREKSTPKDVLPPSSPLP